MFDIFLPRGTQNRLVGRSLDNPGLKRLQAKKLKFTVSNSIACAFVSGRIVHVSNYSENNDASEFSSYSHKRYLLASHGALCTQFYQPYLFCINCFEI